MIALWASTLTALEQNKCNSAVYLILFRPLHFDFKKKNVVALVIVKFFSIIDVYSRSLSDVRAEERQKSVDAEKVGMLFCDKKDGESRQGCEKYLPPINCERVKIPD